MAAGLRSPARTAAGSFMRAWARDRALKATSGFGRAWKVASTVPGWLEESNAAVFYGVVAELRPSTVVEIGSYLGRSTVLLGLALRAYGGDGARLTAIDPHTGDRQQLAKLNLEEMPTYDLFRLHCLGAGIDDLLDARRATSDEVAVTWDRAIDLLYIDGWHSYEAVRSDARNWAARLAPDGVACFDDYGNYPEVRAAVHDACVDLGLNLYGEVLGQAWAGRRPAAPRAVIAGMRATTLKRLLLRPRVSGSGRTERFQYVPRFHRGGSS